MIVKCTALCYYCLRKTLKPKQPDHICRTGNSSASANRVFCLFKAADPPGRQLFLMVFLCGSGTKFTEIPGQRLCNCPITSEKSKKSMDNRTKVKYNNPEPLPGISSVQMVSTLLFFAASLPKHRVPAFVAGLFLCAAKVVNIWRAFGHAISQKGRSLHVISQNP